MRSGFAGDYATGTNLARPNAQEWIAEALIQRGSCAGILVWALSYTSSTLAPWIA